MPVPGAAATACRREAATSSEAQLPTASSHKRRRLPVSEPLGTVGGGAIRRDGSAAAKDATGGAAAADIAAATSAEECHACEAAAMEQPSDGSRSPAATPEQTPAEAAQAKAMQLLEQGVYGRALAAASAATKLPGAGPLETGLATLRLICRLHLAGPTATCWQVLGLAEGASAEDVRRAFRRGAQRVHPDKCSLPRTEAAFKILATAVDQALVAGGVDKSGAPHVAADMGGFEKSGGGAPWWQEWEPTAAEARQQQQEQRQQQASRKRRAWQPPEDSDAQVLSRLTTQALRAEVARRQGAVLSPSPGSDEAAMDPSIRQARLREARSLLSERLKEEEAAAFADTAGGFQRETPLFAARHL